METVSAQNSPAADFESAEILQSPDLPRFIKKSPIFRAEQKFHKGFKALGLPDFKVFMTDLKLKKTSRFLEAQGKATISGSSYPSNFLGHIARWLDTGYYKSVLKHELKASKAFRLNEDKLFEINNREREINRYQIVFSSDFWDIATMSMRGISSCQKWENQQAMCLVGSIVDPFCAVMFLTERMNGKHGTNMAYRCVVRLVFHPDIGPALFLEKVYSDIRNNSQAVESLFAQLLHEKTGLPIAYGSFRQCFKNSKIVKTPIIKLGGELYDLTYSDANLSYQELSPKDMKDFPILKKIEAYLP